MFNELIDEYNNQLSDKNTKNINNFNLEIITDFNAYNKPIKKANRYE